VRAPTTVPPQLRHCTMGVAPDAARRITSRGNESRRSCSGILARPSQACSRLHRMHRISADVGHWDCARAANRSDGVRNVLEGCGEDLQLSATTTPDFGNGLQQRSKQGGVQVKQVQVAKPVAKRQVALQALRRMFTEHGWPHLGNIEASALEQGPMPAGSLRHAAERVRNAESPPGCLCMQPEQLPNQRVPPTDPYAGFFAEQSGCGSGLG